MLLREIPYTNRVFSQGVDLFKESETIDSIFVVVDGLVAYHRLFSDGRRTIFKVAFSGDLVDPGCLILGKQDCSAQAMNEVTAIQYSASKTVDAIKNNPQISFRFLQILTHNYRSCNNWLMAMARLNAYDRVGYFLMEFFTRLQSLGRTEDDTFVLPMNQAILADIAGMHEVHFNRVLGKLRADGFIERIGNKIRIVAPECLAELVSFRQPSVDS